MADFMCSILVAHAKTAGKYIPNGSLSPCPFLVVFVQIHGSLPCSKAPPGAGEEGAETGARCQQPLHRKRGKTNQGDGGTRGSRGMVI